MMVLQWMLHSVIWTHCCRRKIQKRVCKPPEPFGRLHDSPSYDTGPLHHFHCGTEGAHIPGQQLLKGSDPLLVPLVDHDPPSLRIAGRECYITWIGLQDILSADWENVLSEVTVRFYLTFLRILGFHCTRSDFAVEEKTMWRSFSLNKSI